MLPSNQSNHLQTQALAYICRFLRLPELNSSSPQMATHISRISSHMPSVYEWLKIMIFLFKHEVPYATAIKALQLTKLMLETCLIPIINLIQTYLLPYIYIAARHHANLLQTKKVPNPKSTSSRLIHEYESRCFVTVIEWALIKQKRLYQNQQMGQNSLFYQCMKKLTYLVICGKISDQSLAAERDGIDVVIQTDWRDYVREFCLVGADAVISSVQNFRKKYQRRLQQYGNHETCSIAEDYSSFFISKLKSQIKSQFKQKEQQKEQLQSTEPFNLTQIYATILQSTHFPIQCLPKLDVYHLFQTLDPVLTYPLNQIIFSVLQTEEEFDLRAMKEATRALEWLIRWGDLETYLNVVYSEQIYQIGQRIMEVKGHLTLSEGQNIFPQINDKKNKLPFYLQFLNFIEIMSICKIPEMDQHLPSIKLRKIRKQLLQQKFILPQNLSCQKIKLQFNLNIKTHLERNQIFFSRIQNMNVKQSIKQVSRSFKIDQEKDKRSRKGKMETVRNSLALVQVLESQLIDLINTIESKYSTIKGAEGSGRMPNNEGSGISSLREHIQLLQQQLELNQQQNDPYIINQLQEATQKGRKLLSLISAELPEFFSKCSASNTHVNHNNIGIAILEETSYHINPAPVKNKQSVDCLSDVILASRSRIVTDNRHEAEKIHANKQNMKQICRDISNNQLKLMNIQSITSEYGLNQFQLQKNVSPNRCDSNISRLQKRLSLKKNKKESVGNTDQKPQLECHQGATSGRKINEEYYTKSKFKDCLREEEREGLSSAVSYLTARSRSKSERMKIQRVNSQNCLAITKMKETQLKQIVKKEAQPLEKRGQSCIKGDRATKQNKIQNQESKKQSKEEPKCIRLGQKGWDKRAIRRGMLEKCKGIGVQMR